MKTNKEFINGIYEKFDEYSKEKKQYRQRNKKKIVNIAAVLLVVFSLIIVSDGSKESSIIIENGKIEKTKNNLKTIESFENFYNVIKEASINKESDRLLNSVEDVKKEPSNLEISSKTNNQVENVDEADIVKVDSKNIYYISENKVVIIDGQNSQNATKIAEINYKEEEFFPQEMYINKDRLIIIGNKNNGYSRICKTEEKKTNDILRYEEKTTIILYDISNEKEPREIRKIEIDGFYISSRMIGDNIYLASNKNIYSGDIIKNSIEDLNEKDYMPKYTDTAINKEEKCIDYNRIYCFEKMQENNYLILTGLNINNNEEADIQTFLGAGQYIYSSEKNMYIAINNTEYSEQSEFIKGTTHILKFELKNGKINFKVETDINGQINNQFSMDETEEGHFRIATTTGELWNTNEKTSNNLYILNEQLKEVGKISEFAKEEKIYSVRYVGDKAYIVTFKRIDPLFVIDLSNPSNPKIIGELKIPGYSTYLHPYDETHLIGFGYDTKEDGTRITTNGLKMVMFDITDLNNPKELFKVAVGDKYSGSQLTYNHKALLYSKEKNIIGFPIISYNRGKSNSRAVIYQIDLEKGFTLKGEITDNSNDYNEEIERIVYLNNAYYTLSKKIIKVTNMDTLELIKEIEI